MSEQPSKSTGNAPANSGQLARILTRVGVISLVCLLTLAVLAVAVPWARYRYRHVVVGEAVVKGTVTRIGARIEGRIKSIEVELGQHVSKGQVLVRMDDAHFVAEVERARAQLDSATNDLSSERLAIDQAKRRLTIEIKRADGNRKSAAGALEAEKRNLDRFEKQYDRIATLLKTGAAAPADMDLAAGNRDRSRALVDADNGLLDAAQSSYEKAVSDLEGVQVRIARLGVLNAAIAAARAQLTAAESDLEASVLRAPEDGRVLERIVEVGGSAKVGEPMLSLWIGRAWMEAWVDERELRKFKVGNAVEIALDSAPSRKLAGRVEAYGLESDKQLQPLAVPPTLHSFIRLNSMVPVRIALDEDNDRIQLGLSAVVGIQKNQSGPAMGPQVARIAPSVKSAKDETAGPPPASAGQASAGWLSRALAHTGFLGLFSVLAMVALGVGTPWVWHHFKQGKIASTR